MTPLRLLLVNVVDAAFPVKGQLPETLRKSYCTASETLVDPKNTIAAKASRMLEAGVIARGTRCTIVRGLDNMVGSSRGIEGNGNLSETANSARALVQRRAALW